MNLIKDREKDQIKKIFEKLPGPVHLVFFKENLNCETCDLAEQLAREVASTHQNLKLTVYNRVIDEKKAEEYKVDKTPALILEGATGARVRFFGLPSGFEFASLLEALKEVAAGKTSLAPQVKERLAEIKHPVHIQVFVTPSCPFCPAVLRTAHKMAVEFPLITSDMVEAQEFPELSQKYGVSSVPMVVINKKVKFAGAVPDLQFADAVIRAVA